MKVKAWIQMGQVRREVTFEVPDKDLLLQERDQLETQIKELVWAWVNCRYGWGVKCDLFTMDFSFNEDRAGSLGQAVTELNLSTDRYRGTHTGQQLETLESLGLVERALGSGNGTPCLAPSARLAALTARQHRLLDIILETCPSSS